MAERTFYRSPGGTVIDVRAAEAELAKTKRCLVLRAEAEPPMVFRVGGEDRSIPGMVSKRWCVELHPLDFPGVLDAEEAYDANPVELIATLLERALPDPSICISHMTDQEWEDFQGAKA